MDVSIAKKIIAAVFSVLSFGMFGTSNVASADQLYYTNTVDMHIRYTGAIIDCRGLNLSTAMSPVIEDSVGNKIYGNMYIDPDMVSSRGMVGYASSFSDAAALARVGDNPIILKANEVRNHVNPVIDMADAVLMQYSIKANNYFREAAVVFVR